MTGQHGGRSSLMSNDRDKPTEQGGVLSHVANAKEQKKKELDHIIPAIVKLWLRMPFLFKIMKDPKELLFMWILSIGIYHIRSQKFKTIYEFIKNLLHINIEHIL